MSGGYRNCIRLQSLCILLAMTAIVVFAIFGDPSVTDANILLFSVWFFVSGSLIWLGGSVRSVLHDRIEDSLNKVLSFAQFAKDNPEKPEFNGAMFLSLECLEICGKAGHNVPLHYNNMMSICGILTEHDQTTSPITLGYSNRFRQGVMSALSEHAFFLLPGVVFSCWYLAGLHFWNGLYINGFMFLVSSYPFIDNFTNIYRIYKDNAILREMYRGAADYDKLEEYIDKHFDIK